MKFIITLESDRVESARQLVGSSFGGAKIEKLIESPTKEQYSYCCTGSFCEYLRVKKFFGKNRVVKCNW